MDPSVLTALAFVFGTYAGWFAYPIGFVLLLRKKREGPLFEWRASVASGIILLATGAVVSATANAFFGAALAGFAAHQLSLCWQTRNPRSQRTSA